MAARCSAKPKRIRCDGRSEHPCPYFFSTEPRPNRVLLFALGQPISSASLPSFVLNHEVSERGLIFGTQGLALLFAFHLHLLASARFFDENDQTVRTSSCVCSRFLVLPSSARSLFVGCFPAAFSRVK